MTVAAVLRRCLGCTLTVALLAGCGEASDTSPSGPGGASAPASGPGAAGGGTPGEPEVDEHVSLAATGRVEQVSAHEEPGGEASHTFHHPTETGAPLTFMVLERREDWVQVQLPVRPNGSTGWVRLDDVELQSVPYRLEVSTANNELTVFHRDEPIHTYSVATGTGDTPTPHGTYYLTELLAPTNPGYGPYAYGISAFSEVLTSFGAGPGQIGLHGTDEEDSIGRAVSHGCIRLSNEDITTLAELLPLGTPIEIS